MICFIIGLYALYSTGVDDMRFPWAVGCANRFVLDGRNGTMNPYVVVVVVVVLRLLIVNGEYEYDNMNFTTTILR